MHIIPALAAVISKLNGLTCFLAPLLPTPLEGEYVDVDRLMSGGDPGPWEVRHVTAAARRAVGQWPTAESLVARLVDGFATAADHEADPERRSLLRRFADMLGGAGRGIAVDVAAKVVERQIGLG